MERELQVARVKAVTANRPVRVLFNCPAAGQFRRVEMLGEPGLPDSRDDQVTRCDRWCFHTRRQTTTRSRGPTTTGRCTGCPKA